MKELKFTINYQNLLATVDRFPEVLGSSREVFVRVRDAVRRMLDEEEGVLIHGDFWTGK